MTVVPFDTLKFATTLVEAGIPEKQASVHARALAEALNEEVVTKSYLDVKLLELENRLMGRIMTFMIAQTGLMIAAMFAIAKVF